MILLALQMRLLTHQLQSNNQMKTFIKNNKCARLSPFAFMLLVMCSVISISVEAHEGHANQAPWQACTDKFLNDSCSYQTTTTLYKGTCRSIKSALMCVRNQPLILIEQINSDNLKPEVSSSIKVQTD
jgi:hypothetical protein